MSVDVHAHFWTDAYLDKVAALGKTDTAAQRGRGAGDGAELEARLALMDRAGVDVQVLSAAPQLPHGPDEAAAVGTARYVNDQYAGLVAHHPGRFLAFASLPLPHLDASAAELARALDELGMVGVAMTTTIMGQPLVDSPAAQLFAELDRRGTVLYLHPAGNAACTPLISQHHGTWSVGAPVEDTISALHLITHGIPSRYPRMKILNSHLGGALPMLIQRMDNQLPWEAPETPGNAVAGRPPDVVRHRRPRPPACAALRRRLLRRRPPSARHRLSVPDRGRLRTRRGPFRACTANSARSASAYSWRQRPDRLRPGRPARAVPRRPIQGHARDAASPGHTRTLARQGRRRNNQRRVPAHPDRDERVSDVADG